MLWLTVNGGEAIRVDLSVEPVGVFGGVFDVVVFVILHDDFIEKVSLFRVRNMVMFLRFLLLLVMLRLLLMLLFLMLLLLMMLLLLLLMLFAR